MPCLQGSLRQQGFEFFQEVVDVFELAVDGGEADVGDFVDFVELLHDEFADDFGGNFAFVFVIDEFVEFGDDFFLCLGRHGTFFAGFADSGKDFASVVGLAVSALLDDEGRYFFDLFVSRVAPLAFRAFAPAADNASVIHRPGVDDFVVVVFAVGAVHNSY